VHSPSIARLEVLQRGRVRRAKLYYLRDLRGKKARIRERRIDDAKLAAMEEEAAARIAESQMSEAADEEADIGAPDESKRAIEEADVDAVDDASDEDEDEAEEPAEA
jgi:hypothetical protein